MIRVLVVDDSRAFRMILRRVLESAPAEIAVCAEAGDPFEARAQILAVKPDVVTLDVNMPRMDGEQFLRHLMQVYPLPVIVITSEASDPVRVAALRAAGAFAVVAKPSLGAKDAFQAALLDGVRAAVRPTTIAPSATTRAIHDVIAIGASTGGAAATARLLAGMSADTPPIVIAQHILPNLAGSYASWLGQAAPMRVQEARDGDTLEPGVALLPPQDRHLRVVRNHDRLHVALGAGDKINGHRPSIDVLFGSLAALDRVRVAAVLLTGMGNDGAQGLLDLRKKGARTFAQEPGDCVVPAMPECAIRLGAAQRVMPAAQMGYWLTNA